MSSPDPRLPVVPGFPQVFRAQTREEREAIYRFRYDVYYREFGRLLGGPDHERRWVRDADDDRPTTTILYTGSADRPTATVRLRHWGPGQVPRHDVEELSMDRIPGIEHRSVAEIGRLMVRPSRRGRLLVAALVRASYELLVDEHRSEMVFCYCSPGLVHFYRRIAMRPYGGRLVAAPDGVMIPMVSVTSDIDDYRRVGSYLAPMAERAYGPGGLPSVDLEPLRPLFNDPAVTLDPERMRRRVHRDLGSGLGSERGPRSAFLDALSQAELDALLPSAVTIDVEPGALITRKGFREDELYVALRGRFTFEEDPLRPPCEPGGHFGEESLLHEKGRRRLTVRAQSPGRLLVLSGRSARRLLRRRPELAVALRSLPSTPSSPDLGAACA